MSLLNTIIQIPQFTLELFRRKRRKKHTFSSNDKLYLLNYKFTRITWKEFEESAPRSISRLKHKKNFIKVVFSKTGFMKLDKKMTQTKFTYDEDRHAGI